MVHRAHHSAANAVSERNPHLARAGIRDTAFLPRLPDDFRQILQEMERAWGYPLAGSVG